jgi:malate dehydrogenase
MSTLATNHGFNVVVAGAAGGIGQPLSLLLKLNPMVRQLTLCDVTLP